MPDVFDNGLNKNQVERLTNLSKECSDVIKAINEIILHGLDVQTSTEQNSPTHLEKLNKEVADLLLAIDILRVSGELNNEKLSLYYSSKTKKIPKSLHFEKNKLIVKSLTFK